MHRTLCGACLFLLSAIPAQTFAQFRYHNRTDSLRSQVNDANSFSHPYAQNAGSESRDYTLRLEGQQSSGMLPPFGFDLFNRQLTDPTTLSTHLFNLPQDYRLGPGDHIGIYLLGTIQKNINVTVNVEGKIFLPPVGVLDVSRASLLEFEGMLKTKLTQYYDNFRVDLMLLRPKDVMVAVVGDVVMPGKYVLSALNTVLDAIVLAGGPSPNGSIRDIRLIRDGERVATVDLYQFLMSGSSQNDAFLAAGDRIFVPLAENKVTVTGEIMRPSRFELRRGSDERLSDLIELAGGFTEFAFTSRIEISRLLQNGHRALQYVSYDDIRAGDSAQDIRLKNWDHIRIYSKLEQIHVRKVAIFGEIRRPGSYLLEDNMHLSDLILKAGNLTRKAYTLEAEIAKIDPGERTTFVKIDLDKMMRGTNGRSDLVLAEDDQVFIRKIPRWEVGLTVDAEGEMMFPGKYAIVKDSTYLSEILLKAGGFTDDAFVQKAHLLRQNSYRKFDKEYERLQEMRRDEMSDLEYQYLVMKQNSAGVDRIVVDFQKLVSDQDLAEDVILEANDRIVVPKKPREVLVTGSVARAGGVTFSPRSKIDYYLARAGGVSWDGNAKKTKVIKVTGEVLDDEDVESFQPGDIIWVPRKSDKPIWSITIQTVAVLAQLASIYLIIDTATR